MRGRKSGLAPGALNAPAWRGTETRYTKSHPPESGHRGGGGGALRVDRPTESASSSPTLRLTVLDLDDRVTPDGLTPETRAVIDQFAGAYVEFSPSGRAWTSSPTGSSR